MRASRDGWESILHSPVRMAMSPVRRAFVILLVAAGIVALLLMLAQDQETLKIRSAIGAEDTRHSAYISALVGAALSRGNRYDVLTNGDQIFPAMLERSAARSGGSVSRPTSTTTARSPTSSPRRSKRRRGAACTSISSSTPSAAAE